MGYPYVVCDYNLILDFTSSNILISSRCIYLNVLKGASEYLLEMANQNEETKQQEEQNPSLMINAKSPEKNTI